MFWNEILCSVVGLTIVFDDVVYVNGKENHSGTVL